MDLGWKLRNSYLGKKKRHLRNPWTDIKDQNVGPCATKISPDLRPFPPPRTRGAPVCAGGSSQWWPGAEICSKGAVLYWSWNLKQKVFPVEVGNHDLQSSTGIEVGSYEVWKFEDVSISSWSLPDFLAPWVSETFYLKSFWMFHLKHVYLGGVLSLFNKNMAEWLC